MIWKLICKMRVELFFAPFRLEPEELHSRRGRRERDT